MEKIKNLLKLLCDTEFHKRIKENQTERYRFENAVLSEIYEKAQLLQKALVDKEVAHFFPHVSSAIQIITKIDYIKAILKSKGLEYYYDFEDDVSFVINDNTCTIKLSLVDPMYKYTIEKGIATYTGDDFVKTLNRLINDCNCYTACDDEGTIAVMEDEDDRITWKATL